MYIIGELQGSVCTRDVRHADKQRLAVQSNENGGVGLVYSAQYIQKQSPPQIYSLIPIDCIVSSTFRCLAACVNTWRYSSWSASYCTSRKQHGITQSSPFLCCQLRYFRWRYRYPSSSYAPETIEMHCKWKSFQTHMILYTDNWDHRTSISTVKRVGELLPIMPYINASTAKQCIQTIEDEVRATFFQHHTQSLLLHLFPLLHSTRHNWRGFSIMCFFLFDCRMPAWSCRFILRLLGVTYEVKGLANINKTKGGIVLMNHQSALDLAGESFVNK